MYAINGPQHRESKGEKGCTGEYRECRERKESAGRAQASFPEFKAGSTSSNPYLLYLSHILLSLT